jgi:hypothetical protein
MSTRSSRIAQAFALALSMALVLAVALSPAHSAAAGEPANTCPTYDVDYAVTGALRLKGTPLGAADGTYPLGNGTMKLRFFGSDPAPRAVRLLAYSLDNRFTVNAKTALWSTRVMTQSRTSVGAGGSTCDGAARGALDGQSLQWLSKVAGYRSDGTLTCQGSMCGKFGAPPAGTSPLHAGPAAVSFSPFTFSADRQTFTMPYSIVEQTSERTSYLALSGRETSRACVIRPTCQ